jgi:hypothetical protein
LKMAPRGLPKKFSIPVSAIRKLCLSPQLTTLKAIFCVAIVFLYFGIMKLISKFDWSETTSAQMKAPHSQSMAAERGIWTLRQSNKMVENFTSWKF